MEGEGDLLKRPVAVVILAVINWLAAALLFLTAAGFVVATILKGRSFLVEAGIFASLGGLAVFCGYGLLHLKKYGRTLQCVFAWAGLPAFPIGTIVCILILVYMYKEGTKVLFSEKPLSRLTPEEVAALEALRQSAYPTIAMAVTGAVLVLSVPITGIIAAIAIPNFLNAVEHGRQKRAMADMREIGRAMESYKAEHAGYPPAASISELAAALQPRFIPAMASRDPWGNEYRCATWQEDPRSSGPDAYAIASAGRQGVWEQKDLKLYRPKETMDLSDDIVYRSGAFLQAPPRQSP